MAERDIDVRGRAPGAGEFLRRWGHRRRARVAGSLTEIAGSAGRLRHSRKDAEAMNHRRRPHRAAAIVAAFSMLLQPTAHLFAAMASQGQPTGEAICGRPLRLRPRQPPRRARSPPRGGRASRWRVAAHLQPAERRQHPRLSAADFELGQADPHGRVQRGVLSQQGRRQARARHNQDRGGHEGRSDGAAGQLSAR